MPRRTRRVFTPTFKAEVVRDLLTGKRTHAELCREHQLSPSLLTLWKESALERLPVLFQAEEQRDPEQARIAELKQPLVLFRNREGLGVRYPGNFLVDGQRVKDRSVLAATAHVSGEEFSLAIEPALRR